MKKSELNDLKLADLDDMISENQTKLQNLRFQKALQQLEDPLEIRSLKKEIAQLAREHNNANIIALPARFITLEEAKEMVDTFLTTEFEGGRHERRVNKIACG